MKRIAYVISIIVGVYLAVAMLRVHTPTEPPTPAPAPVASQAPEPSDSSTLAYIKRYPLAVNLGPRRLAFAVSHRLALDAQDAEFNVVKAQLKQTGEVTEDRIYAAAQLAVSHHPGPEGAAYYDSDGYARFRSPDYQCGHPKNQPEDDIYQSVCCITGVEDPSPDSFGVTQADVLREDCSD